MHIGISSHIKRRSVVRAIGVMSLFFSLVACGGGSSDVAVTEKKMAMPPAGDLSDEHKKDIAMQLVSSAENSSLDWRAQYAYIEDIDDGRGYTGGIIGFTSATGDMLEVVEIFTNEVPENPLAAFLPALRAVNGSASHEGLEEEFVAAWEEAAASPQFRAAQDLVRDREYFNPSVALAKSDGLGILGQFIYYDAAVVHGRGSNNPLTLEGIRAAALNRASPPSQGGSEIDFLNAFLDERVLVMKSEPAHEDVTRIETAQRVFLQQGNLSLSTPLYWKVYEQDFSILE